MECSGVVKYKIKIYNVTYLIQIPEIKLKQFQRRLLQTVGIKPPVFHNNQRQRDKPLYLGENTDVYLSLPCAVLIKTTKGSICVILGVFSRYNIQLETPVCTDELNMAL